MPNRSELVRQRLLDFNREMQTSSERHRVAAYMRFIVTQDDLRWIVPKHADAIWDLAGPMYEEFAKAVTKSYNTTMLKIGADAVTVKAYPIGPRSKHWPRYRDTYHKLRRLPQPYWAKTLSLWYEHDTMPYLFIRGRVIFWPGLDHLCSVCAELECPDSVDLSLD